MANKTKNMQQIRHILQLKAQGARVRAIEKTIKLRFDATLPEVHCSTNRNLSTDQIALLASCNFIRQPQNIIITGTTGCGKSFLACALGRHTCQMGYKILYLKMNRFIEKIAATKLDGTYIRTLNQIEKTPLLILDDFGIQPLDQNLRLALFQILEDRYAKKPIIVASQLPLNQWHEYLNEPTLADAILDHLTANAQLIPRLVSCGRGGV